MVTTEGQLLYRSVLLHSHTNEQPFARSGSPVPIASDQQVWVRAHMKSDGYASDARNGCNGFEAADLDPGFAAGVVDEEPLPTGCAF